MGDVATEFFQALSRDGIEVLQFKSSRTLDYAFAGLEDFDLLIDPKRFETVRAIAEEIGFRERRTSSAFHPAAVTDLLAWDPSVARLHHLSLHRELVFGEKPLKRHALPWRTVCRLPMQTHRPGLNVLIPPAELALLVARITLRSSVPLRVWSTRRRSVPIEDGMRCDFRALDDVVTPEAFLDAARLLFPGAEERLARIREHINAPYSDVLASRAWMEDERRGLLSDIRRLATRSAPSARASMLLHARSRRERHLGSGLVVAVVGADGAGKSTTVEAVCEKLGMKLSVRSLYLGLPRSSALAGRIGSVARALRRAGRSRFAEQAEQVRACVFALIRAHKVREARRARRRGITTLTDRYPLIEFQTVIPPMDGPRLGSRTALGRLEARIYRRIPQDPDIIIALDAPDSVLLARKPADEPAATVAAKADAVRYLSVTRPQVVRVDATLPADEVANAITNRVWSRLTNKPRALA